jgi:hypothetical protein
MVVSVTDKVAVAISGVALTAGVRLGNDGSTAKGVEVNAPGVGGGAVMVTTPGRSLGLQAERIRRKRIESRE